MTAPYFMKAFPGSLVRLQQNFFHTLSIFTIYNRHRHQLLCTPDSATNHTIKLMLNDHPNSSLLKAENS